jgi:hypothetical protein
MEDEADIQMDNHNTIIAMTEVDIGYDTSGV